MARKTKFRPRSRILPKFFILIGIFFLVLSAYFVLQRFSPKYPEHLNIQKESLSKEQVPIEIQIPALDIRLKVKPSNFVNGKFETITDGVSHFASTPIPGEKGNSILYGHNWSSLLGSLPKIKIGDEIKIILSSGEAKNFIVKFTTTVDPSQTQILAESSDSRITIYTCDGFLDSKRFVAVAFPTK